MDYTNQNYTAPPRTRITIPKDKQIYQINLNSRTIDPPQFIGVSSEHNAECIYFEMDRYFDTIDLAESIGLILFKNAKNQEYYQLISNYDTYTKEDKIIFPWVIQAPAVLYSGTILFAFKFFGLDRILDENGEEHNELAYQINTTIANTKVLHGWTNNASEETYVYDTLPADHLITDSQMLDALNTIIKSKKYMTIYWQDASEIDENNNSSEEYENILEDVLNN